MAVEQEETRGAVPQNAAPPQSDYVRMEFIGSRDGAATYTGKTGRSYRAGRHPANRYIDAHKDDVAGLENMRLFKVVQRHGQQSPAQMAQSQVPIAQSVPEKTEQEKQEERRAILEAAKAEAAKELAGLDVQAPKPRGRPKGQAKGKGAKAKAK